jgi:tetraprenyl-beta-curcumene synthase
VKATVKQIAATLAALGAYLTTVLPRVRRELPRWRKLAEAIPDPDRRRLALAALEGKTANVEAVAVFAILAPRSRRRAVLRAIVPLQVAIDYLDTLEEAGGSSSGDGYLAALQAGWVREVEALPGCRSVVAELRSAVDRCAEGQRRTHAAEAGDVATLEAWARQLPAAGAFRWWELAAGASSSVAAHALIAAAASAGTTVRQAEQLDAAYNPSIGALTVLLDGLVDSASDAAVGAHNYIGYYRGAADAADGIGGIARGAAAAIAPLPRRRRHQAILAGVAGFYLGQPGATGEVGRAVGSALTRALGPSVRMVMAATAVERRLRL